MTSYLLYNWKKHALLCFRCLFDTTDHSILEDKMNNYGICYEKISSHTLNLTCMTECSVAILVDVCPIWKQLNIIQKDLSWDS